ncbi:MAG: SPOR domain-containing protein [Bacteroidales bacterium]|nr:SPOR domain-containing protein [Bacteroidales bacterium]
MKRTEILFNLIIFLIAGMFAPAAFAQTVPDGYEMVDSVVYRPVAAVDSTLAGKDIFHILPSKRAGDDADVQIRQSQEIMSSMRQHIASNSKRTSSGYRVRIFFDNKQTARNESEKTLKRFKELFPGVAAYRIYANPYFKVTVGDFRTKSEAMALLTRIKGAFPSAFVVKESIEYPVVDSDNAVIADTVKVMRKVGK